MHCKIKIDDVHKYLSSNDWIIESFSEQLEKVKKVYNGKEMSFLIPLNENLEDYDFRISRFIKATSDLEKKKFDEIYDEISNIGFDVLNTSAKKERLKQANLNVNWNKKCWKKFSKIKKKKKND